jgi:hypothetical protein
MIYFLFLAAESCNLVSKKTRFCELVKFRYFSNLKYIMFLTVMSLFETPVTALLTCVAS